MPSRGRGGQVSRHRGGERRSGSVNTSLVSPTQPPRPLHPSASTIKPWHNEGVLLALTACHTWESCTARVARVGGESGLNCQRMQAPHLLSIWCNYNFKKNSSLISLKVDSLEFPQIRCGFELDPDIQEKLSCLFELN